MRSIIVCTIALVLVGHPAEALRGVVPTASCERVRKIEEGLGSRLRGTLPREPTADYRIFFEGTSHGHDASISYTCQSGTVTSQMIAITVTSEHDGHAVFSDLRREITAELGPPPTDLDEPSVSEVESEFGQPVRRLCTWVAGARAVNLTLWRAGGETWEVVVTGP